MIKAIWFFIRLGGVLAIGFWISGMYGSVHINTYGFTIHMQLWVALVCMFLVVFSLYTILRFFGWANSSLVYITRTRKLYKQIASIPHILNLQYERNIKQSILTSFGKKHPLSQIAQYTKTPNSPLDVDFILQTDFAESMIRACITKRDVHKISDIQAFYSIKNISPPPILCFYESTQQQTLDEALLPLTYVQSPSAKVDTLYYTACAHVRFQSDGALSAIFHAWKGAYTDEDKWRICVLCQQIQVKDISILSECEKNLSYSDDLNLLFLAVLSAQANLWGPANTYLNKVNTLIYMDKKQTIDTFIQYKKNGKDKAYITYLQTECYKGI